MPDFSQYLRLFERFNYQPVPLTTHTGRDTVHWMVT